MDAQQKRALIEAALRAREAAYAPYSNYHVGAAILDDTGKTWTGCNVENASYGLSMCAERTAIFQMVAAGSRRIAAVAVATANGGTPCGACRQVLAEFAEDLSSVPVLCSTQDGPVSEFALSDLLPEAFKL